MNDASPGDQPPPSLPPRRWLLKLVLALAVGVVAAGGTRALVRTPKHTVRTLVHVPPPTPYLVPCVDKFPDLTSYQRNQIALCKSEVVLKGALHDLEVANLSLLDRANPQAWLEKEVQVDFTIAPNIMRISMNGLDTDELVILVSAIRRAYLLEAVDRVRAARRERQAYLEKLVQKYEGQVKAAWEIHKSMTEQAGGESVSLRARVLAFAQQQLALSERELLKTEAELRQARALRERAGCNLEGRISFQEARINTLEATKRMLEPEVERLQTSVAEMGKKGVKLDAFREDVGHLKDMWKRLKTEQKALKVELQAPPPFSVLEEATVSRAAASGRPLVAGLVGLGGFLFAFACLTLRIQVSLR
jgi:hypothetical protein